MSITIESLKIELASLNKQIEEMKQEILANKEIIKTCEDDIVLVV